jgi:hypothetical protein
LKFLDLDLDLDRDLDRDLDLDLAHFVLNFFGSLFFLVLVARIICAMFILIFLSLAAGDDG